MIADILVLPPHDMALNEWDNGTAMKPQLGSFIGGQPDKEKKAAKCAVGKVAFRLAQFKKRDPGWRRGVVARSAASVKTEYEIY